MYAPPHVTELSGTLAHYSGGGRGVRQTLAVMRRLVNHYKTDLGMLTNARNLIFLVSPKDEIGELDTLFTFVRDNIRYTRDVNGVETISSPDKTLATQVGDCDDKTVLLCTLAECVGFPTRFVVTGYNSPREYEHVYAQVFAAGQWIACDTTESYPLGWEPPDPLAYSIEAI
jgi:transglutaminase-like putative cysteine protease